MPALLRWLLVLLLLVAALLAAGVAALAWFDWNRAKPWVNTQLSQALDRQVAIDGDLTVQWQRSTAGGWQAWVPVPHITAQQITIGNPSWAQGATFASADRIQAVVRLLPLLTQDLILEELLLDNAQLNFERGKARERNWEFGEPTSGGDSWHVSLNRVRLGPTAIRYTDPELELDIEARLTSASAQARDDATAFDLKGRYREAAISGSGTAGSLLSLGDPAVNYPFHLQLTAGEIQAEAKGHIGNLRVDPAVNLAVDVRGPSMALLYPLTGLVLPPTAPFHTSGTLVGTLGATQAEWQYQNFQGRMGASDIQGELRYRSREPRPLLSGKVHSEHLQLVDLGPLIGLGEKPIDPAAPEPELRRSRGSPSAGQRVLPDVPFHADRWQYMDLDLDYQAAVLLHGDHTITQSLQTQVRLQDRKLSFDPLAFDLGGGRVQAEIGLNSQERPVQGSLSVRVDKVQLQQVLEGSIPRPEPPITGAIHGQADLNGRGESLAALLGSSQGKLQFDLEQGEISQFILEAAALDVLNAAMTKLFGDKPLPIQCARADFSVKDGVATTQQFELQTHIAYIDVDGHVDLGSERLALTLHAHTLTPRIFSLRSPIEIRGDFRHPSVHIDKGPLLVRAGAAAALAVLATPALAVLPLISLGSEAPASCTIAQRS